MKFYIPIVFLSLFLLTGCGLQVVPRATGQVSLGIDKKTLSAKVNGLTYSAKLQDLDFGPYTGENNITAFYVTVANNDDKEWFVPLSAFLLFDQDRKLYRPLESDRVKVLTQQEQNYLVPYPYVGFYYLKDSASFDYSTQASSNLAYSPSSPPLSADAYALPVGMIPPGSNISGMIFFNIDLYEKTTVDLSLNLPGRENSAGTKTSLLFEIVK